MMTFFAAVRATICSSVALDKTLSREERVLIRVRVVKSSRTVSR
jgi:hypothetical protein